MTLQFSRSEVVLKSQVNESLIDKRTQVLAAYTQNQPIETSGNNYCVLYDSLNEYSPTLKDNVVQSLDYMKKKSTVINAQVNKVDLTTCHTTILTTDQLTHIGSAEEIEQYVFEGGYLFFATMLDIDKTYQVLYRKFGISNFDSYIFAETKGIHLVSNVLIGEQGLKIDDDFMTDIARSVHLDKDADLLVESGNGNPILWRNEYGKGAFMTFNGTLLHEKMNRGLFTGALSLLEPNFIYSIFNSKVFYIDDFPAPIAKGNNSIIYEEYKRDTPTFFKEIWWPNMLKTAKNYDIKYTGAIIESYNDRITPPFHNTDDKDGHYLISYGRELIKSGGELGFHGYNHQSLVFDEKISAQFGYHAWQNESDITEAFEELVKYTKKAFPGYKTTSYVPPSNVLSAKGREALKKGWPDVTVIASLYGEDKDGLAYTQEFEVAEDGIIEMPRITSGYFERGYDRWAEANTITGLGVFSHFVHPDDVISSDRGNDMAWDEMYKQFDKNMYRVYHTYPWMRSMPSTEAALDLATVLQTQVNWETTDTSVGGEILNFQMENYYIFRTEKKIKRLHNCEVEKIDKDTYLIKATAETFKIDLEEF